MFLVLGSCYLYFLSQTTAPTTLFPLLLLGSASNTLTSEDHNTLICFTITDTLKRDPLGNIWSSPDEIIPRKSLKTCKKVYKNIIWERLFLLLLVGSPSNSLTSEDHNNMFARMDCYQTIFYLRSMIMILKGVIILLGPPSHCFYEEN